MSKKILNIVIVLLIIMNISMFIKVNNVEGQLSNINQSIQNLSMNINNIESSVASTMHQIKEENSWLYNVEYKVANIDKDLKNSEITLTWSVRDLSKDYKMYMLYGVKNEKTGEITNWTEILAEDLGNLNYRADIKVSYQNDYEFKIMAKNDKNTISERLTEMSFLSQLKNRINMNANPNQKSWSNNEVNLSFNVHITNRYNLIMEKNPIEIDESLLKIKNVKVKIYSDSLLKKEIELMKNGKIVDEKSTYGEPFKYQKDIKIETIDYSGNLKYESKQNTYEEIEVIVEDYLGRTYTSRSHGI